MTDETRMGPETNPAPAGGRIALPGSLALIDDDQEFARPLAGDLIRHGIPVTIFDDSDALLAGQAPFDFEFYLVDLGLPGIDGVDLIRILRRRSEAGIVVISARLQPEAFDHSMHAGTDMFLTKPVRAKQVILAIEAVQRRIQSAAAQTPDWQIDETAMRLIAPDGAVIDLSATDLTVMNAFLHAQGGIVSREHLRGLLGLSPDADADSDNLLHAAIYRLRRKIERATPLSVPLQTRSRRGYVFRAPIRTVRTI